MGGKPLSAQQIMIAGQRKGLGTAMLLAVLFGPVGLLYATPLGGAIMIGISIIVGGATLGVGLFFCWLASMVWAYSAVSALNARIDAALRAPQ